MSTKIKLSESLQKTIALEQRALADGGTLINRNNTVNNIPYVLLNHVKPTFVIDPAAYKVGKLYSVLPNTTTLDVNGVARNSVKTAFNKDGELQTFAVDEPSINWINGRPYINSERGGSNLVTQSSDFAHADWSKLGTGTGIAPVITTNAEPSIFVGQMADRVDFNRGAGNTSSDQSRLRINIPHLTGNNYTGGFWVKAATTADIGKEIAMRPFGGASFVVVTLTNEWQRGVKTLNATVDNNIMEITNNGGVTADNQVSVIMTGVQCEQSSNISSDIQTSGTSETRVLDRLDTDPIPATLNDTQGTVYFEFYITDFTDSNRFLFCLRDGGQRTEVFIRSEIASSPRSLTFVLDDAVSGLEVFVTTNAVQLGLNKMVLVYDGTNVFMTLNGVTTPSTVTYSTTKNRLRLGEQRGGGQNLDDNVGLVWYKDAPITQIEAERETTL